MLCQRTLKSNFLQIYNVRITNDVNVTKNIKMNRFYSTDTEIISGVAMCLLCKDG